MPKKAFFKERSARQIERMNPQAVYTARDLVERIDELGGSEALALRFCLIPPRFLRGKGKDGGELTTQEATRKAYKHGDLIVIDHPESRGGCDSCSEIPLAMRARSFQQAFTREVNGVMKDIPQEELYFMGFSYQPGWGDRLKRVFPFVWGPEGVRLFGYAENETEGIKVELYPDSGRASREGASFVVEVPSRTVKNPRYRYKLLHVPVKRGRENLASVLTLKPALLLDDETGEPEKGRPLHDVYNIRYTWRDEREGSDIITMYPQDLAAYLAVVRDEWRKHNITPMEMNPFELPSRHQAEFYKKLCNNILIYDSQLKRLRKLHLAEKSILLGRGISVFGHDDFAFWDPARDGKLKDYDWSVEGGSE